MTDLLVKGRACYDLHTHTTASDGLLTPSELTARARESGVTVLAVTDHDCVDGVAEARSAARGTELQVVPGVEISVTWKKGLVHVVGLRVDPDHPQLRAGLARLQGQRLARAEEMDRRLNRCGIVGALAGARAHAGSGQIGRAHFARHLVAAGHATDMQHAFVRYLRPGRPAYVPSEWSSLEEAVAWIRASGGEAVIAHPARYRLKPGRLRQLLQAFLECGGIGLEVVSGVQSAEETRTMAELARRFGLLASAGSDFHAPGAWSGLGRLPPMPTGCRPIWADWDLDAAVPARSLA